MNVWQDRQVVRLCVMLSVMLAAASAFGTYGLIAPKLGDYSSQPRIFVEVDQLDIGIER